MIEISNATNYRLPRQQIQKTVRQVLRYLSIRSAEISIVFVTPGTIKKLNNKYRKKNKPTDVLSFSYFYKGSELQGEIMICYSVARDNAKKFNHSTTAEIKKLLAHSLLHLVGWDHEKNSEAAKMEELENKILEKME